MMVVRMESVTNTRPASSDTKLLRKATSSSSSSKRVGAVRAHDGGQDGVRDTHTLGILRRQVAAVGNKQQRQRKRKSPSYLLQSMHKAPGTTAVVKLRTLQLVNLTGKCRMRAT
jgi:hypothetical protein